MQQNVTKCKIIITFTYRILYRIFDITAQKRLNIQYDKIYSIWHIVRAFLNQRLHYCGMIKDISVFTQRTQGSLQTVFELSRAH